MELKKYFKYSTELELIAAQIGMAKWDWECLSKEDEVSAQLFMNKNGYDIVPLVSNNIINKYYRTEIWGDFSKIKLLDITKDDTVYYRLSFVDLLKKMVSEERSFYFISNSDETLGLVTIVNFNCLAVYNYLYQVIADLETSMSLFIKCITTEEEVLDILAKTSDKTANKIAESFKELRVNNLENSIYESLYFPTFSVLLKNISNTKYNSKNIEILNYRKKFNSTQLYGQLRNKIAHPIRPIFTSQESLLDVATLIRESQIIKDIILP